jgi:hypothetical protein
LTLNSSFLSSFFSSFISSLATFGYLPSDVAPFASMYLSTTAGINDFVPPGCYDGPNEDGQGRS